MIKRNNDIRTTARENGVYLYEIAEKLNVSEPPLTDDIARNCPRT